MYTSFGFTIFGDARAENAATEADSICFWRSLSTLRYEYN